MRYSLSIFVFIMASRICGAQETVPDFILPDINPNSVRYEQAVSPNDYKLQVSAYYFGSAG